MKISIDAGALCSRKNHFGNYIFTQNLIRAISNYDNNNKYVTYLFCDYNKEFNNSLGKKIEFKKLKPKIFWLSIRVGVEELINKSALFLALNQAVPLFGVNKAIIFLHGLSFYFYPQFYSNSYKRMINQIDQAVLKSNVVVVSSVRVKKELQVLYPNFSNIKVIPFGIPFDVKSEFAVNTKKEKLFLFAGMNHKIKNIDFLIDCFNEFINIKKFEDFKLYLVGNFENIKISSKKVVCISGITRTKLKDLYKKATAYLTASFYESFNFPVVEALSMGCPVIGLESAIIPEFKKYVSVVKTKEDFITQMKKVSIQKNNMLNISNMVKNEFSWQKYISKLIKLYD